MSETNGLPRIAKKSRLFTAVCAGAIAFSASQAANAAFVISGGSSESLPISANDFNGDLQGLGFSQMTSSGAQLSVDQDGFVTFYYIAAESWYNNSFHTASGSMTEADDAFNFNGYDSITINVSAGELLDFSFQSANASALTPVDNSSGTNLEGLGIMTGDSELNSLEQLVLAYNDNRISGDADYDDMLVRADFSAVPVPAAAWLFGSGLLGLIGAARRRKA